MTIEEANLLIQNAREHIKPVIMTALNTGMRLEELLSLKWNRVHLDNMATPSIELVETKNNKKRFVPLNDNMVELLKHLKKESQNDNVFINPQGKPLKDIRTTYKNSLQLSSIEDFRFHDLRHTFASHYLMNGGDLMSLKEILGHSSLKMVERYSHLTAAYKQKLINNLTDKFYNCQIFAKSSK